jgi:predicted dehydrogenase
LKAGKHVLVEKLMAHNIAQCKVMGRLAYERDLLLATGHQRHYSILYDNAVNLLRWGLLGKIHHIRAQWHRGNLPGRDSWQQPLPGGEVVFGNAKPRNIIQEQ